VSTVPTPGPPAAPAPVEPGPPRGGCGRGALIGCGVALLLVIVCLAVFVFYARRKPEVFTDLMMSQVERHYAPDVTAEEKDRLRSAYARFRRRLEARQVSSEPLERLRTILSVPAAQGVSREKVRELTEVFEAAAAGLAVTPPGRPEPVPTFSPTP
jgi:hypothetical protein